MNSCTVLAAVPVASVKNVPNATKAKTTAAETMKTGGLVCSLKYARTVRPPNLNRWFNQEQHIASRIALQPFRSCGARGAGELGVVAVELGAYGVIGIPYSPGRMRAVQGYLLVSE